MDGPHGDPFEEGDKPGVAKTPPMQGVQVGNHNVQLNDFRQYILSVRQYVVHHGALAITLAIGLVFSVVGVFVPEIRCRIGLEHDCRVEESLVGSQWSGIPEDILDASADRNVPYAVPAPPATPGPPGTYPVVELAIPGVINRGKPVAVSLSGRNFFRDGSVEITWYEPSGAVLGRDSALVDDRGLLEYVHLWVPLRSLGVGGNDGPWRVEVKDRVSGNTALAQFGVHSDDQTPPLSRWPAEPYHASPFLPTELSAVTSGAMCTDVGARSVVRLRGFSPGGLVEIVYYRPDGSPALRQGVRVDGVGGLALVAGFWKIAACSARSEFRYEVVAMERGTGRTDRGAILLKTRI
jgi:hypothetical protein